MKDYRQPEDEAEPPVNAFGEIVIEEESLREDYTKVPNTILKRADLSPGAKLTYVMLLSYAHKADRCFPGQERLAEDIGAGVRSVVRYLQELVKRSLLRVKRRGLGKTNIYFLTRWSKPQPPFELDPEGDQEEASESQSGDAKLALQKMPDRQTEKNKSEKNKNSNAVRKAIMEEGRGERQWTRVADLLGGGKPMTPEEPDDWLADQILQQTGDSHSRGSYLLAARNCPPELVFEALSLLKDSVRQQAVKTSRGALFVAIVRRLCDERGLADPWPRRATSRQSGNPLIPAGGAET